jgi:hypothetical protein
MQLDDLNESHRSPSRISPFDRTTTTVHHCIGMVSRHTQFLTWMLCDRINHPIFLLDSSRAQEFFKALLNVLKQSIIPRYAVVHSQRKKKALLNVLKGFI